MISYLGRKQLHFLHSFRSPQLFFLYMEFYFLVVQETTQGTLGLILLLCTLVSFWGL